MMSNYVRSTSPKDLYISLGRMLIEFIEDKNHSEETWRGYVYAASMFVSAILQSLVLQQYFHIMFTLGMRVRSSVIGLLYEKVSINKNIHPTHLSFDCFLFIYYCLHRWTSNLIFSNLDLFPLVIRMESVCTCLGITRKKLRRLLSNL